MESWVFQAILPLFLLSSSVDSHRDVTPGILNWGGDMRFGRPEGNKPNKNAASSDELVMTVVESQVPLAGSASLSWEEVAESSYNPCIDGTDWIGIYCGDEPSSILDESPDTWQYVTISDGACTTGAGSTQWLIDSATVGDVCEFRIFDHEDGTSYNKIGTSNTFAISAEAPAYQVSMMLSTTTVDTGDEVTLTWKINDTSYTACANGTDWVGFYCGSNVESVADAAYLDYSYVTDASANSQPCETGMGEETLAIQSGRLPECQFRMFSSGGYTKVGDSSVITVADVASLVSQVHIALTADPTEMRVHFTTGTKTAPTVAYGSSAEKLTRSVNATCITYTASEMCQTPATSPANFIDPGWLCEAVLSDLTPDATVYYAASSDGIAFDDAQSFIAAPASDPDYAFTFIVYADMGTYSGSASYATAAISNVEVLSNSARMVHHIGDISYARGYAVTWEAWFELISPYSGAAPYMIGIGNHEYDHTSGGTDKDPSGVDTDSSFEPSWGNFADDSGGECGVPMDRRFTMPNNGNGVFWYEFSFANVHTIMLSSEHNCSYGSDQYIWLEKALSNVDRTVTPWLLVETHRPMYNNERYPGDYSVAEGMQNEFEELLIQHNVDLVLAGHYHSYLRSTRIYKDMRDDENGIYHYTIGSAGASLDSAGLYDKDWVEYFSDEWGIARITVANRTHMKWEFIQNDKDEVVDSAWITNKIYG